MNYDIKAYENIRKIASGQIDDHKSGYLLDYLYLKEKYSLIATDVSKQLALDSDLRVIKQINFTEKLECIMMMIKHICSLFLKGSNKVSQ